MGEGSGVLVLESLEHAMKRGAPIIAEYLGGAVNCDAYHMTDPRSDGLGVSSCIQRSLEDAGVSPEEQYRMETNLIPMNPYGPYYDEPFDQEAKDLPQPAIIVGHNHIIDKDSNTEDDLCDKVANSSTLSFQMPFPCA